MKKLQVLLAVGFTMMAVNGFAQHTGKQTISGVHSKTGVTTATTKHFSPEEVRSQMYNNIQTTSVANNANRSMFAHAMSQGGSYLVERQPLATMPVEGRNQLQRLNNNMLQQNISSDTYNQTK